ncbi:hypothetical protein ASG54_01175 [Aureimonas sp. Leaf460]|nr:hypothetical protein ASG62_03905 [Aureimonas sp. Leaf427]KQT81339.1 hypothetical protein ASG54_01175 [Aureimonas sp. Leaf460]
MQRMRAGKSDVRKAKIDALIADMTRREMDVAARVAECIKSGKFFDRDSLPSKALKLAYLHFGDDK